jgi:hypothetical protein
MSADAVEVDAKRKPSGRMIARQVEPQRSGGDDRRGDDNGGHGADDPAGDDHGGQRSDDPAGDDHGAHIGTAAGAYPRRMSSRTVG